MKQIKTVIMPIGCATQFDEAINRLLENGWQIIKRELRHTQGSPDESFSIPIVNILYAELERGC